VTLIILTTVKYYLGYKLLKMKNLKIRLGVGGPSGSRVGPGQSPGWGPGEQSPPEAPKKVAFLKTSCAFICR